MHTCLTLSHANNHPYLERDIFRLIGVLESYCDSIQACDVTVAGPSGEGASRCWEIELKLRIFDETVRAAARTPEGGDPQLSLSRALTAVYAKTRSQLAQVAEQHHGCCVHCALDAVAKSNACA